MEDGRDTGRGPDSLPALLGAHGPMPRGTGLVSGVIALVLAVLCALGALAFHFPEYLSTPEARASYDVDTLRWVMLAAMLVSGAVALTNVILDRTRWLGFLTFTLLVVTALAGGPMVPVGDFPDHTPYLGVDYLVLSILGTGAIFVFIEKLRPLRPEQPIFRREWQTDALHFVANHLLVGFALLITTRTLEATLGWATAAPWQRWVADLPFALALLLAILAADLAQYWIHRAMHEVPALWKVHSVHHSVLSMDWLAGSRLHLIEILLVRTSVLAPLFFLGFAQPVLDAFVVIVGFQAVLNHANVDLHLGPLRYVIVTPNFHHWHHSRETEAIDKNYAAQLAFLDHLFGTAVQADRLWPQHYGVVGDYVPRGFWAQQFFPFVGSTTPRRRSRRAFRSDGWTTAERPSPVSRPDKGQEMS